jgi:hypothetical protein
MKWVALIGNLISPLNLLTIFDQVKSLKVVIYKLCNVL